MKTVVVDTSALLALFFDEPGAEKMEEIFTSRIRSRPARFSFSGELGGSALQNGAQTRQGRDLKPRNILNAPRPLEAVRLTANWRKPPRILKEMNIALGLADAFAARAWRRRKKAELVTGDAEFKPLEKEIKINWLK